MCVIYIALHCVVRGALVSPPKRALWGPPGLSLSLSLSLSDTLGEPHSQRHEI